MSKQKKCLVQFRLDAPGLPWAVIYGESMVVSRHEIREIADRVCAKLNAKIERSDILTQAIELARNTQNE